MKKIFYPILLLLPFSVGAQIKVGNNPNTIDPSSILELEHPNKALYLSRVSLSSTTDVTTVPSPKAGMMVYNTNVSITGTGTDPILTGGIGVYVYDGARWVGAGSDRGNAWKLLGNPGTSAAMNFIGTTDNNPLNVRTNNTLRATFRPDGTMAFTNASPLYADNIVEFKLDNVGGPVTSGEQNQGVNVLASALNGAAQSTAIRGRNNVEAGSTVSTIRGVQGNANVEGTANGGVSGAYFNASLKSTGALGSSAVLSGVSADAEASSGGTSAATNTFIGGRFGGSATNAVNARAIGALSAANGSNTSNVGVYAIANDPTFANYAGLNVNLPAGFGAGIVGMNPANAANNFAGYFYGKNRNAFGNTMRVVSDPGAIPGGTQLSGTYNSIFGSSSGAMTSLYTEFNSALSISNNVRLTGSVNEAYAGGTGLGATGVAQATGSSSTGEYLGSSDAPTTDYVVGVRGSTYTVSNKTNGLNVVGAGLLGGTFFRSVGGYFLPAAGSDANLGVVAQVGGTENQAWKDAAHAGKNVGLVAVNYNPASANDLALYTDGAVQMKNLGTGTPIAILGVDAQGNVSTTTGGAAVTADNGLTKTGSNIQLGGSLLHNTTVTSNAFNTLFTGSNPASGASVVKVENNAGAVADGSDLFANFNSISGTNGNAVGNPGTLRAQYNNASTASNNMRVQGALNEASTSGKGLGANATPQATGITGLADYVGSSDAPTTDFLVGVRGAAYTTSNKTNGLNVVGQNFGGSYFRSVGGYFYPNAGTDANLGIVAQTGGTANSGWQAPQFAGKNISVAAINTGNTGNDYAGYFLSTNPADAARSLNVELSPAANSLAGGGNSGPFATSTTLSYPGTENTGSFAGTIGGLYSNANTSASDYQAQGALLESSTTGGTGAMTHAIGAFGLATGNSTTADPKARIIGIGGATNFQGAGNNYNGIAVNGYNAYDNNPTTGKSVGGHFDGTGGATEFGVIGTVGDVTAYQTMFDGALNLKHIGVAAVNHNTAAPDQFALYTEGAVQMKNLGTTTPTALLGIDAQGNLSTTTAGAAVTADNGLTKTGGNIQLGGTLLHNTTVTSNAFNTLFTGSNPASGASIVKVENNAGAVADGSDLFANFNSISGTNANAVGNPGTLRAQYNNASTASNNMRVQGALNEASTSGKGLGANATPQATGITGLADYVGSSDAPTTDFLVGVRGAAYTTSNKTNGLNVVGQNFGGTYFRSVGGYFYPNAGTDANLGIVAQTGGTANSGWQAPQFSGKNISVAGINTGSTANDFAGYFVSNNTASTTPALFAENKMTTNFTAGDNPFGAMLGASGTDGQPASGNPSVVTGVYPNASTTGDNVQTQAVLAEASTSGKGLGAASNIAQVVGSFGLADYTGASDAGIDDYATGSAGSPYTSSKAINGIGITGSPYTTGYYRMIGGYFRAAGGTVDNGGYHHANIGMVSQVGGTKNQAWRDLTFNDKNIGVVAVNYNPASLNDLALYTDGAVQMKNLGTTTATSVLGVDGSGNVSATAISGLVTADNGLTKTGGNIQLGGTLLHNTTVTSNAFNTLFTGSNPASGASIVKVENNAGAVADGSDLFANFNSISGTNANAVGNPGTLRAQYNNASTASNNMRVQGALNEASTSGKGLGANATPQATGITGLADYVGSSDAPTTDFLVGVRGAAYTTSNKTNGLNVVGQNFGGTYFRSVGGYFYPNAGTDANLGIVAQTGGTANSGWQAPQFSGKNISVAGINTGSTANDFAGYFVSNNTASTTPALFAENKMTTNFTAGDNPFGAMLGASGTDGQPASGNPSVVTGVYPNASTTGDNVQTQAVLAEASTSGKGLGAASNIAQVVGSFGLADYTGASDAGIDDYATGSAGSPYTSSKAINGIGITGSPYTTGYYRMIGGYFRAAGGTVDNGGYHHANIGMVSQVGGTKNQAWRDLTFNDKNIGVVAVNYNTASLNDLALYTKGAVQMHSLTGTGASLLTIDPVTGNVGASDANTGGIIIPAGTTAQQPASPAAGTIRFNTTTHRFEGYTDDINTTNMTFPEPGWVELSTN